ncbi:AraC family transcriptional regulator [Vibrio nigripulchritudo]|uniref:AraC family transcriptional regulator n=1 Tax=Vibrio nigripulchritudo TaxID=28173 RepID=UPI00190919EA|nr:AraC family transcriptional regulator [Vibrio nigripulchritudo]BCL73346.1 AraC family transcriptional regulator [Vibrio nigripulchritudo]BDU34713.1 AraC family transcriptional regulator [Vibrio nigripulchritudo]
MNYQTFQPHPDLESLISCYWTLEVPEMEETQRQRIIPDGNIEMAFILGDDIKRYTSEDSFILQPRAMVLGHIIDPFYIEATGRVDTFAIRFYPYGFANFITVPIKVLENTETPLAQLFDEKTANQLEQDIIRAADTKQRIEVIESFLLNKLSEQKTVDNIVKTTIDTLFATKGSTSISKILKEDPSKRRQLERMFVKQIGVSPKQLGKLIRIQSALKMMLNQEENLTQIAYQNDYYDQSHFIKDFKEFTGVSPKEFLGNENMILSSMFYK